MPQRGLSGRAGGPGGLLHFGVALLVAVLWVTFLAKSASAQQAEADVFVARAILAYEEKRYDEALADLRQALELDPNHVDALYYTGLVHLALGRLDEAAEALERARTQGPKDEAILFQLGVVYFSQGKYEKAQPLLEQVFAVNPRLESLGYYVGFMRYRNKDYQGALRAFRAGATSDPNIQQLTGFYTGLALGVLGLPERAAAEIEKALMLQPASPLTGPAERLRDTVVAARERERRFRAEVRAGGFFDDNVPVTPKPFRADPLVPVVRGRRKESPGWLSSLRLDYSFLRLGALEATATYSLFTTYNNDLPKFNIVNHLGGLGGTYRGALEALPYQLALQYNYDFVSLGGTEFVQRHTVAPFATLVENANNLTALQLRAQVKDFHQARTTPREERRDGTNWMAGFTHIFRFEGDKHLLKLGYQWDFDDTDGPNRRGRNFSYLGNRVLAGAQYTSPWGGLRLRYDFDVHLRDYEHKNSLLPVLAPRTKARFDTEYTHILGASLPLPNHLTLAAEYQHTVSRSNLAVFTFNRNVFSLSLIWSY